MVPKCLVFAKHRSGKGNIMKGIDKSNIDLVYGSDDSDDFTRHIVGADPTLVSN